MCLRIKYAKICLDNPSVLNQILKSRNIVRIRKEETATMESQSGFRSFKLSKTAVREENSVDPDKTNCSVPSD